MFSVTLSFISQKNLLLQIWPLYRERLGNSLSFFFTGPKPIEPFWLSGLWKDSINLLECGTHTHTHTSCFLCIFPSVHYCTAGHKKNISICGPGCVLASVWWLHIQCNSFSTCDRAGWAFGVYGSAVLFRSCLQANSAIKIGYFWARPIKITYPQTSLHLL